MEVVGDDDGGVMMKKVQCGWSGGGGVGIGGNRGSNGWE